MADTPAERPLDLPHPQRLSLTHPRREEILRRHSEAMAKRLPGYRDPASGLFVFTAKFLADRGWCCNSGCRHCPFVA